MVGEYLCNRISAVYNGTIVAADRGTAISLDPFGHADTEKRSTQLARIATLHNMLRYQAIAERNRRGHQAVQGKVEPPPTSCVRNVAHTVEFDGVRPAGPLEQCGGPGSRSETVMRINGRRHRRIRPFRRMTRATRLRPAWTPSSSQPAGRRIKRCQGGPAPSSPGSSSPSPRWRATPRCGRDPDGQFSDEELRIGPGRRRERRRRLTGPACQRRLDGPGETGGTLADRRRRHHRPHGSGPVTTELPVTDPATAKR